MKYHQTIIISVAIICITLIELYALKLGYDGVILAAVIAVIAGIAGFEVKPLIQLFKKKPDS